MPISATGTGGRQVRVDKKYGNIFGYTLLWNLNTQWRKRVSFYGDNKVHTSQKIALKYS